MAMYKQGANGPVGPADRLDGGSVPDRALSSQSGNSPANDIVTAKFNEIEEDLSNKEDKLGEVSVTADGIKTYAQILGELGALIDVTKLNEKTTFSYRGDIVLHIVTRDTSGAAFSRDVISGSGTVTIFHAIISTIANNSHFRMADGVVTGATNMDNNVPTNGWVFKVTY